MVEGWDRVVEGLGFGDGQGELGEDTFQTFLDTFLTFLDTFQKVLDTFWTILDTFQTVLDTSQTIMTLSRQIGRPANRGDKGRQS